MAALLLAAGCASPSAGPTHALAGADPREGTRILLETDLEPPIAQILMERLEKTAKVLDEKAAWLAAAKGRVTVLVVGDEARYREIARSHDVTDPGTGAFACSAGEVVIRFRPDEWGQGPQEGWFVAPRSAPVSEALFRQRLEAAYGGSLERTRVEDGCARVFASLAAREIGEAPEAARRERDDLLAAFLPIFLGAEPTLGRTATATGRAALPHGSQARAKVLAAAGLDYAVARFLLESEGGSREVLEAVFLHATEAQSTTTSSKGLAWEAAKKRLEADEAAFERWLRDACVNALLDALANEPVQAARWEARAALRFITGLDVGEEGTPDERARTIARVRQEAKKLATVRFTDEFDARLLAAKRAHGALDKLVAEAKRELDRRASGYGHPAVEEGRARLGQALQERLRELTASREPG